MGMFQKIFGHIVDAAVGESFGKAMFPQPRAKKSSPEQQKPTQQKPFSIETLKEKIGETREKLLSDLEQQLRNAAERQKADQERAEESRAREPWYRFVHLGIPIVNGVDFQSSNVQWMFYDIEHHSLYVEYIKNGCTYRYWPVDEKNAMYAYSSSSKGKWVWSSLRVRKTKLGHQVNYILTGKSPGGSLPKWTNSPGSIQVHDTQVGAESQSGGPHQVLGLGQTGAQPLIVAPYKAIAKFALSKPKLT